MKDGTIIRIKDTRSTAWLEVGKEYMVKDGFDENDLGLVNSDGSEIENGSAYWRCGKSNYEIVIQQQYEIY